MKRRRGPITKEWLLSHMKIDEETDCWEWNGYRDVPRKSQPRGYGQVGYKGKVTRVHRVAYEIFVEEIPVGMQVLHRCDNPPCFNPEHLFLGTQSDNLFDMGRKGRYVGNRKLTEEDVKKIREDSRTQEKIAADYETTRSNIYYIKRRKTWRGV